MVRVGLLAAGVIAALVTPSLAQAVSLPGGASTLNETHGAWTVTCAIGAQAEGEPVKRCALSQTQMHSQTRQRALAIELYPGADGVGGTLVLPFGLALPEGVTFQLDDGDVGAVQQFRTCLPAGCLVDVAFDARTVESLKAAGALKVKAAAAGGDRGPVEFAVSLEGFTSAYERVVALTQ